MHLRLADRHTRRLTLYFDDGATKALLLHFFFNAHRVSSSSKKLHQSKYGTVTRCAVKETKVAVMQSVSFSKTTAISKCKILFFSH